MPTNDRQLVRRSLAGERAAFGALYARHAPRVFHLLRRLTNHVADAEDLTQETFLAAFSIADRRFDRPIRMDINAPPANQERWLRELRENVERERKRAEQTLRKMEAWEKSRR